MDNSDDPSLLNPGIYMITNSQTGMAYIGSTIQTCWRRWRKHLTELTHGTHRNVLLQDAFKACGAEAFTCSMLEVVTDRALLAGRERHWLDLLKGQGLQLYNLVAIGRGLTYRTKPRHMRVCQYPPCGRSFPVAPSLKGLYCCHEHYILHTKRPLAERFWEQVDRSAGPNACWRWKGSINQHGYGRFSICTNSKGVWVLAHRWIYERMKGPILPGFMVCHACDVRPCVQPKHLSLGTAADNTNDMVRRGRMPKGDQHYTKLHPENIKRGAERRSRNTPKHWQRGDTHYMRRDPEARKRVQGEHNPRASFSDAQAAEIFALKGTMTGRAAAKRFHVTPSAISELWSKKTYAHIHHAQ